MKRPNPNDPDYLLKVQTFDVFWQALLTSDWETNEGPMKLRSDLSLADLAKSDLFHNVRVFLHALAASDGTSSTAAGNLNRAFVTRIFETLRIRDLERESIRRFFKVLNEQDLSPLHIARIVSECAGLVARRSKRFQLTKLGRQLLADDQSGGLFRRLFIAHFRKFDLSYGFQFRQVPDLQQTMAGILWRLDVVAENWKPVLGLASSVLTPGVHAQLRAAMVSEYDTEGWILSGYVLLPLKNLGLIECKKPSPFELLDDKGSIRQTELWKKFIYFPKALPLIIPNYLAN
jgi:hypothetical protein